MRIACSRAALWAAVVLAAVTGPSATAADWPMLGRTQTRNPVSPEAGGPLDWHPGAFDPQTWRRTGEGARNVKWVATLGSQTSGDPVVADGLVWVGTNNSSFSEKREDAGALLCFRERDGELLYRYVSPRLAKRVNDWPFSSITSSPFIEHDRLWFITNRSEVVCLDIGGLISGTGDARVLWKVDLINDLGIFATAPGMGWLRRCSPAGYKDWIYVITGNGFDYLEHQTIPKPEAPSLLCLEKKTGRVIWSDSSPGENILQGQWTSPLVMEIEGRAQCIAPMGDGWVRSFDAVTGELLWEFDINPKESKFQYSGECTRNSIIAPPVYYEGNIYIASGHNPADFVEGPGRLVCIDPTKTGDVSSELAVDADGNPLPRRRVQAVDPSAGERAIPNPNSGLVWEFTRQGGDDFMDAMHYNVSSIAAAEGLVIAADSSGLVHCLDAKTGQRHWAYDLLAWSVTPPLIVDGKIYIADDDGEVAVFRLSPDPDVAMTPTPGEEEPYAPIAKISMGASLNCSPVFANGVLYLATYSHLFAVAQGEGEEPGEDGRMAPATEATALGEWQEWRGPDRANRSPETGLLSEWPEGGPPLVWRVEGLGQGIASVSIADGRIFTSTYSHDTEYIVALDQRTGRLAWAKPIGAAVQENPLMRWLSQRTPTLDEDRLYVLSAEGCLFCLSTEDGRELWQKHYVTHFDGQQGWWGFCDYPLVDGDKLICAPRGDEHTFVALEKLTGETVWSSSFPSEDGGGRHMDYSATVVTEAGGIRQYVNFIRGLPVGVAADDGRLLWSFDGLDASMNGVSPAVREDLVLLTNPFRAGKVTLLKLLPSGSGIQVREEYTTDAMFNVFQDNLVQVDGYVYGSMQAGPLCVELSTGKTQWGPHRIEGGFTALVYADGHLYLRSAEGHVQLIEASPDAYKPKSYFRLPEAANRIGATAPVIAGGHLYLRDDDRLFAYDIRQNGAGSPRAEAQTITIGFAPAPAAIRQPGRQSGRDDARPGPRSVFVPTPQDVVEKMLELADVQKDDLVYDLGSGDGRIVITAAKKYRSRAVGVEIDGELVEVSRAKAEEAGLADLVTFEQRDIFEVDLSKAGVVAVYLLPNQLERLIPQLEKLSPGARIVSHQFAIPGIPPDRRLNVRSEEDGAEHTLHLWIAPLGK